MNTFRGMGDDDDKVASHIERKFSTIGWAIGKRSADDLCPKCVDNRTGIIKASNDQARKRSTFKQAEAIFKPTDKPMVIPVHHNPIPPTTAEHSAKVNGAALGDARAMGRDDRRLVFDCINEHWEKDGYKPVWTDTRVAEHLGCPLRWVVDVRKEFFGEVGSNAAFDQQLAEAEKLITEFRMLLNEAGKLQDVINTQHKKITDVYARMTAAVGSIDKLSQAVDAIRKAVS
jgi:hypothetical protein